MNPLYRLHQSLLSVQLNLWSSPTGNYLPLIDSSLLNRSNLHEREKETKVKKEGDQSLTLSRPEEAESFQGVGDSVD